MSSMERRTEWQSRLGGVPPFTWPMVLGSCLLLRVLAPSRLAGQLPSAMGPIINQ